MAGNKEVMTGCFPSLIVLNGT